MKIIINGRKCTPRDSFKEHAEKKLAKVAKFFDDDAEAKITATVEKSCQIVEVTVATRGMYFRSEESAPNMNEALDTCIDSIIRQIRRNKTRVEKRLRTGNLDSIIAETESAVDEEETFEVLRTKSVVLKPESVEEAILQMNLLGHMFYMFRNAETAEINVVYKRKDGGYGVLVPEIE
ncbi:MAG: ribosome-associated translation inhibitor RaiA [Clostridia bacterium]|nr:ribosome-associated translation inhibitor RaiA [Clostridia bacterium]